MIVDSGVMRRGGARSHVVRIPADAEHCDRVPHVLHWPHDGAGHKHRVANEQQVLEDAGDVERERGGVLDERHRGQVEYECDGGVGEECKAAHLAHRAEAMLRQLRQLGDRPRREERECNGAAVVEEGDRREAHAARGEQQVDEAEAQRLGDDCEHLQREAERRELDLRGAREEDARADDQDARHQRAVGLLEAQREGDEEDGDGRRSLDHLDEGHRDVEVRGVAEAEA
eukprot:CAMPEP_0113231700 /NCGR_PEP_ID=MMETSP0008_2-20120614/1561_1 /TAXON_ID=97485 /ORGANISM="Prymnesium parvum" /LENGTH=228 /DNA_ID=CAMNT_0000078375 /DNA_START=199 /DNA_END=885 /DNA_ORIENTATION=- /assembly_acc=CAM_ASM_000153